MRYINSYLPCLYLRIHASYISIAPHNEPVTNLLPSAFQLNEVIVYKLLIYIGVLSCHKFLLL